MTSAITPEMRRAIAEAIAGTEDPGRRLYYRYRFTAEALMGANLTPKRIAALRRRFSEDFVAETSPKTWAALAAEVAAELRAEALREAIAVAEAVRAEYGLCEDGADLVVARLRALAGGER